MSVQKKAEPTGQDVGFSYETYERVFLAALSGMIQRSAIMLADAGHYRAIVSNIEGFSLEAEKVLRKRRLPHLPADPGGVL